MSKNEWALFIYWSSYFAETLQCLTVGFFFLFTLLWFLLPPPASLPHQVLISVTTMKARKKQQQQKKSKKWSHCSVKFWFFFFFTMLICSEVLLCGRLVQKWTCDVSSFLCLHDLNLCLYLWKEIAEFADIGIFLTRTSLICHAILYSS